MWRSKKRRDASISPHLWVDWGKPPSREISDVGGENEMIKNELPLIAEDISCIMIERHPRLIGQTQTEEMVAILVSAGFQLAKPCRMFTS